ncbi:hypothetical protein [Aequorivita sp. Q41]|uniref:hypothetical protein n=1 Tax=Aequorivita sp. Q41 TaxID=3153300 RepID=UPI003241C70C
MLENKIGDIELGTEPAKLSYALRRRKRRTSLEIERTIALLKAVAFIANEVVCAFSIFISDGKSNLFF